MSPRILHVGNGHATTGLIERSSIPGRTMVWCDPLNEGPVPGGISEDELLRVRAGFHARTLPHVDDVARDFQGWRDAVDDGDAYDELVLWYEHDLFDQLNLIQLLTHLHDRGPLAKPVTLVCINSFPGHPNFKGLGELEPGDLAALFPRRQPVTEAQLELASRAWQAFRAPDPRDIEMLIATDPAALPFLAAAFRRHLQEFPSVENGLSQSEARLLELASGGVANLRQIFPRMQDGETAYFITDSSLWDSVLSLALVSPALLNIDAPSPSPEALPDATIELTAAGGDVLGGSADRVRLCGIDRWFGGVHAQGRGQVWRWNACDHQVVMA